MLARMRPRRTTARRARVVAETAADFERALDGRVRFAVLAERGVDEPVLKMNRGLGPLVFERARQLKRLGDHGLKLAVAADGMQALAEREQHRQFGREREHVRLTVRLWSEEVPRGIAFGVSRVGTEVEPLGGAAGAPRRPYGPDPRATA